MLAKARVLAEADLGQDPSVSLLPRLELQSYMQRSPDQTLIPDAVRATVLQSNETYQEFPSYLIPIRGATGVMRTWSTAGPPLWVSLSLLGRATTVWRAVEVVWHGQGYSLSGHIRMFMPPSVPCKIVRKVFHECFAAGMSTTSYLVRSND